MELQLNKKTEHLNEDSRVWIYQSDRELTADEVARITDAGNGFVTEWASHGKDLEAAFAVLHNRFLLVITDEAKAMASGCSIDKSVHFIQHLEQKYQVNLFDRMVICYEVNGEIEQCSLIEVPELIKSGRLNRDTYFYDNTIISKGDLSAKWKVRMGESWMRRYFD